MEPRRWVWLVIMASACGVDEDSLSSSSQAVGAPNVLARFKMTGAGAAVVASTNGAPWDIQYLSVDRYITDQVPAPVYVGFGGNVQDPTSYWCGGPYGCYYAAGYSDYGYGELPTSAAHLTTNGGRLQATVPPNSDTFYSERCTGDSRTGYRECHSLEGYPIDITWQSTGQLEVNNGIDELDFGNITLRRAGRYAFTLAHAEGTLVGVPIHNELESYITSDQGNGVWIEVTQD